MNQIIAIYVRALLKGLMARGAIIVFPSGNSGVRSLFPYQRVIPIDDSNDLANPRSSKY